MYTCNKTLPLVVFGELSASIQLPLGSGWLKDYEASQKAFRRRQVNVNGFPNAANVKQGHGRVPEHCKDMPKHPDFANYNFWKPFRDLVDGRFKQNYMFHKRTLINKYKLGTNYLLG